MEDPENPITVPQNRAIQVLPSGHKLKIFISVDPAATNCVRIKFSQPPTQTKGILLSPGDKMILEDSRYIVNSMWAIGIGGDVDIEVGL